jgi:FMN phosphatase YigB (HAD superfamily)
MAQPKDDRTHIANAFSLGIPAPFINPMMTIFTDLGGTLVEGLATAQRDWADFVQRRIREDVAVTRHLMNCHSLADMHQVYSQYLQTAFQHYREQSEKVLRRSESVAQHLAETVEADTKESMRARH